MKKFNTSLASLERLIGQLELEFITQLLAVIWRVIAAVQSFFYTRDHARQHRQI